MRILGSRGIGSKQVKQERKQKVRRDVCKEKSTTEHFIHTSGCSPFVRLNWLSKSWCFKINL